MAAKVCKIEARFTEEEFKRIDEYAQKFGLSRSAVIRMCCASTLAAKTNELPFEKELN